jgi:hypothetical protein
MNETQERYNNLSHELMTNGLLFNDQFYVLGTGSDFDQILTDRYEFFQRYLDDKLPINNAFFVFGATKEYNAWALGDESINILLMNAHVFIGNTLFYETRKDLIKGILAKFSIPEFFDNGLDTVTIMRQTAEMYLFYHEAAHLIQAQDPLLVSNRRTEDNNSTHEFQIINHVAELDADMFANVRIATHIIKIVDRDKKNGSYSKDRIEKLCSVIVGSYLLYRNLILGYQPEFYTEEHKHPHLQIRMFAAISDISNAVEQNVEFELDRKLIVTLSMDIMDELIQIHPEINHVNLFLSEGQKNFNLIRKYYQKLLDLVVHNKGTAYVKGKYRKSNMGN